MLAVLRCMYLSHHYLSAGSVLGGSILCVYLICQIRPSCSRMANIAVDNDEAELWNLCGMRYTNPTSFRTNRTSSYFKDRFERHRQNLVTYSGIC